jgi:2-hydroxy-6-oxonona-2,4-dienedioate hydrolase
MGRRKDVKSTCSNYVFLHELKIHYVEAGQPKYPPVIMIHGLGGLWANWSLCLPFLMGSYRCIALDLPGFGLSDKPDMSYSIPSYRNVIKGFMQTLSIDRAVFVGHSMGGQVALDFVLSYPDRVICAILVSPYGVQRPSYIRKLLLQFLTTKKEDIRFVNDFTLRLVIERLFYRRGGACEEMVQFYQRLSKSSEKEAFGRAFTRAAKGALSYTLRGRLQDLKTPVFIVYGRNDRVIPLEHVLYMKYHIPAAKVATLNGCGHMPQIERPRRFATLVLDFLQSQRLISSDTQVFSISEGS